MEPMPSSEPTAPAPLTRRTNPALADRSWLRSRRVQTFGLGALCGALGLSLLVVVTTILGASQDPSPLVPAPVSEPRPPASVPTIRPSPARTPTTDPVEQTDAAMEPDGTTDEEVVAVPAPEPAPTETQPPVDETESTDAPGNSDNAPGRQKKQP
jgi:cytoskeletal protein RodZ